MIQLFLQMDIKKSLLLSLQVLESFKKVSGLKLNHKNWSGSLSIWANTGRDELLFPEKIEMG